MSRVGGCSRPEQAVNLRQEACRARRRGLAPAAIDAQRGTCLPTESPGALKRFLAHALEKCNNATLSVRWRHENLLQVSEVFAQTNPEAASGQRLGLREQLGVHLNMVGRLRAAWSSSQRRVLFRNRGEESLAAVSGSPGSFSPPQAPACFGSPRAAGRVPSPPATKRVA